MNEIEAKILEIEPEKVEEKIKELGGRKVYGGEVESLFFDFPDGRMEEKGVMRLRETPEKDFMTQKKEVSRKGAKEMEEYETEVSDFQETRKILEGMGMEVIRESSKNRQKYYLDGVEIVVDTYPGIPPLLEIEAENRNELKETFEKLGYKYENAVFWDASQVIEHYRNR